MPLINVRTSVAQFEKPQTLLKELSKELSALTGKPESYVMTLMQTNVPMTFAGTNAPCCYVEIKSIGAITPAKMTAAFCEIISKNTTIPTNRIYIAFEDVSPDSWGWDGRVFG